MFENLLKDILLQFFIRRIYNRDKSYYFPIFSHAPKYLNLAYPDFTIQYFFLSLKAGEELELEGVIPRDKIVFWSVCLYDRKALPFWSKNDSNYETNNYKIPIRAKEPTALIIRFYVKEKYKNEDFYKYLPKVTPERQTVSKTKRIQITGNLFRQMKVKLMKRYRTIDPVLLQQTQFFLPGSNRRGNLFANPNAFYLAFFPKVNKIFRVKLDVKEFQNVRFAGFMSCDFQTTETKFSYTIDLKGKQKRFDIILCPKKKIEKVKNNFKRKIIIPFGTHPIIIYRLVVVSKKHHEFTKLNNVKKNTYFPKIKEAMQNYYPDVQEIAV
jgi:hypothetical protein